MGDGRREQTTFGGALSEAAAVLRAAGVDGPRREAALLLTHASGRDRAFLFAHDDEGIAGEVLARFRRAVERRAAGEPAQYITGRQEFYGLEFEVTPDVLIPRPETELLVETALELLRDVRAPRFCDVGTGSGCVAVALLKQMTDETKDEAKEARAVALDISEAALRVAARNAARHGVAGRLTLLRSDCFDALRAGARDADARGTDARFDVVVSNPPYIPERDIDALQREVREHEPRAALTPGGDGLAVVRRLVAEAPDFLTPGGHLLFEIGFDQHARVAGLIDPRLWTHLGTRPDLQGIPRAVVLRLAS